MTRFCKRLDLFGRELIAIDGRTFKAVTSKDRNFTEHQLKQLLKQINERLEVYLKELDQQDAIEAPVTTPTGDELREKIATLQARQQKDADLLPHLEAIGASQISFTDADSRSLKTKHGTDVCYNVQLAVDHHHKLIVEHEVTNDVAAQAPWATRATRARATLETDQLDALADRGYDNGDEVKKCVAQGIVPSIPKPNTSAQTT